MSTAQARAPKQKKRRWGRKVRNWVVGLVGPRIVRAWIGSLRLRIGEEGGHKHSNPRMPAPGIYVFWHQTLLILAGCYRDSDFRVLVSQHGDGEMIARVLEGLGMRPIRGSSTRGGARAVREILRDDLENAGIAITPDGPRGPRHVFQEGAIYLASRTGLPIYTLAVSARHHAKLPTWDGFMLPCPGTAALVRYGAEIHVPPDLDREGIESYRQAAEKQLRELTESTDRDFEALYRTAHRI